jgi:hypothetical protein
MKVYSLQNLWYRHIKQKKQKHHFIHKLNIKRVFNPNNLKFRNNQFISISPEMQNFKENLHINNNLHKKEILI